MVTAPGVRVYIKSSTDATTSHTPACNLEDLEERSGHKDLQLLVVLLMTLGVVAVLVFEDDPLWLRLGIVAALWATFLESCIAMTYRSRIAEWNARTVAMQAIYEHEISCLQEDRMQVDSEIREQVNSELLGNVVALREELHALSRKLGRSWP